jgi:hypothetical protein
MRPKTWNFLWEVKTVPSAWNWRSKPGDLASESVFEFLQPFNDKKIVFYSSLSSNEL